MQDGNKNKAKAANDDNPHEAHELNGDEKTESLSSIPANVEPDPTLCKETDNSEGEPLVVSSVQCVEPRPLKKSKVEVDETLNDGTGNLFLNLDIV
jgi:tRNA-dihydrouridine synthase 3